MADSKKQPPPPYDKLMSASQLFDNIKFVKLVDSEVFNAMQSELGDEPDLEKMAEVSNKYKKNLEDAADAFKSVLMSRENKALGSTPTITSLLEAFNHVLANTKLKEPNQYLKTDIKIDPYSVEEDKLGDLLEKMWKKLKPALTETAKQSNPELDDAKALKFACKKFIQKQQKRERRPGLWFNQFASVAAGFTNSYLTWQWAWQQSSRLFSTRPFARALLLPFRVIFSFLAAVIIPVVVNIMANTGFIPIFSYSNLANGNLPHQANLKIDKTTVISMGMPCLTRPVPMGIGTQVYVNPMFKKHLHKLTEEKHNFLYVCLLENKTQEVKNVEALKELGRLDSFFFMQMPPHSEVQHIVEQLKAKTAVSAHPGKIKNDLTDEIMKLIKSDQCNYFISKKIKDAFGGEKVFNSDLRSVVAKAVNMINTSEEDYAGLIHHINANLTEEIRQKVNPSEMCCVCKDGMDRGYAFQQNLASFLEKPLGDNDSRAIIVAGRPINANIKTIEEYQKFNKMPKPSVDTEGAETIRKMPTKKSQRTKQTHRPCITTRHNPRAG